MSYAPLRNLKRSYYPIKAKVSPVAHRIDIRIPISGVRWLDSVKYNATICFEPPLSACTNPGVLWMERSCDRSRGVHYISLAPYPHTSALANRKGVAKLTVPGSAVITTSCQAGRFLPRPQQKKQNFFAGGVVVISWYESSRRLRSDSNTSTT